MNFVAIFSRSAIVQFSGVIPFSSVHPGCKAIIFPCCIILQFQVAVIPQARKVIVVEEGTIINQCDILALCKTMGGKALPEKHFDGISRLEGCSQVIDEITIFFILLLDLSPSFEMQIFYYDLLIGYTLHMDFIYGKTIRID